MIYFCMYTFTLLHANTHYGITTMLYGGGGGDSPINAFHRFVIAGHYVGYLTPSVM